MEVSVNIKKLSSEAISPQYAKLGDAGLDLVATEIKFDKGGKIYSVSYWLSIRDS